MSQFRIVLFLSSLLFVMWSMRQAAGRLAPKVGIGGILFLVTRRAVLIGWVLGAGAMLSLMLPGAIATGHDSAGDFAMLAGLSLFCGLGLAALVVGPGWLLMRAFAARPVFELEPGEELVREMAGSHFLHGEGRGGRVLLTTRRLAFRPHRFNVQLDLWSTPLADIQGVAPEGSRFLVVTTRACDEPVWIVVPSAAHVIEEIRARMGPAN